MKTFEIRLSTFYIMILLQDYGGKRVECGRLNIIGIVRNLMFSKITDTMEWL